VDIAGSGIQNENIAKDKLKAGDGFREFMEAKK